MKTKRTNRLLALLLSLVMVVGLLPMSVLAAGEEDTDAPVGYEYVLDEDGIDIGGVYAIYTNYDTSNDRLLYCSATGTQTDMLTATRSGNTLKLTSTGFATNTQLWEVVEVEVEGVKGIGLKSLASEKYLKVKSSSGTVHLNIDVDADEQALTITAKDNSPGRYKVVQDGWSLNWSGTRFQAYNSDNGYYVRFYKQTPVWQVTFTGEGVSESTAEVRDGGNATLPTAPTREGYTFQGWYVGEDEFTAETEVTANVTATAKWEAVAVEPETPETEPRLYFAKAEKGANPWTIISEGTGLSNTLSYYVSGTTYNDVTELDAKKTHRIFASSEGTPGYGFLNVTKDDGDVLVATPGGGHPNNTMVTFEAQAEDDLYLLSATVDGTKYYLTAETKTYNGASGQPYNNKECAVFKQGEANAVPFFVKEDAHRIYCVGPYTVSFNGEGVAEESIEAMYGQKPALPTPTREGFTFQGWYVGEDEFTAVTGDMTLTAKWEEIPGEDDTPAYTPADAAEAGYDVHYLSFTDGWTTADSAYVIKLYQAADDVASATNGTAVALDTDGVDTGRGYVIVAQEAGKVMHYSETYTNQCTSSNPSTVGDAANHLFLFEKNDNGSYAIRHAGNEGKYLTSEKIKAQNNNNGNQMDELTIGANGEQFYVTPANDPNNGTYYIWYQTEKQTQPDPAGQTYASPADAIEDGKIVTYFAFNISSRYWAAVNDTGAARCDINLYQTANNSTETSAALVADTDGVDNNTIYVLIANPSGGGNAGVLHYTSNSAGGVTNQCRNGTTTTQVTDAEHLFVIEAVDGGYSIRANGTDKYLSLDASGNQRAFKSEPTAFYITPAADPNDGTYYIWTATEPEVDVITPPIQPAEPYTMAQTKFSGTSDKPMDRLHILNQNDDVDTEYRIPALVTLDNGWIVAACDIRWTSTEDSPNNLDTIVSVSKDGGVSWEWEVVNYFSDFAPINVGSGRKAYSASFIDPALLVDSNGTLWMAVDLQPAHVNLNQNAQKTGSGFDTDGLLMVAPISEEKWETKVNTSLGRTEATRLDYEAQYQYRVDINGVNQDSVTATAAKDGEDVTVYAIFHKDTNEETGYYVDAFFDLYYNYGEEGGIQPVIVAQKESTEYVQANLFYIQSPWKAYSTTYLMIRKATVAGDGLAWGDPQLISGVKNFDGETFLAFCPGRGTETESGRIIFPVYDNATGEKASSVYTDDGGLTWHRGERIANGETSSNSESQAVVLHDADGNPFLRMFSRNTTAAGYVSYADSFDNGVTWTATKFDRDMPNGDGTMMSFINLEGYLVSPEGAVYGDVVLASYPRGGTLGRRSNGIVRIGYYDAENETMVWLNDKDDIRYPWKFTYSCVTQLRDENGFTDHFAILYEDERNWTASRNMEMAFDTCTTADLLGEGWSLAQTRPTEDKIIVEPIAEQFYTGEAVEPAVTVKKNGVVMTEGYTVEYANNIEVGEATATVTVGEVVIETTFQIAAYAIAPIADQTYTGSAIRPAVTVTKNGETMAPADYAVFYGNNTEVGEATVTVRVEGIIVARATFRIVSAEPDEPDVYTVGDIAERSYTGEAIEPVVLVYKNGALVTEGYTVEYSNNVNVGTATVTVLVDGETVATATFRILAVSTGGSGTVTAPNGPIETPTVTLPSEEEIELEDPDVPLADSPMLFADVAEDDWFYEAIKYNFEQDMMDGLTETEFAPRANTTRAMIVTILYRMEKEPETALANFSDVSAGRWYAESVAWGQSQGIVEGMEDGTFRPMNEVTREELATFLYRYAKYRSYDVTARGELTVFHDGETTSSWATDYVSWAVANGLIQGKENDTLDPQGTATRAEVATILMRFCENFMK